MSNGKFSFDDYIDVAERIQNFKEVHPDGSLQTIDWNVTEVGGRTFVVYRAAAYRGPDDARPGHGIAWEPFPGATPYTRNSELMNAETAAWGRAIVALGLTANRKLASRQEVRARTEEQPARQPTKPSGLSDDAHRIVKDAIKQAHPTPQDLRSAIRTLGATIPGGDADPVTPAMLRTLSEDQAFELCRWCAATPLDPGSVAPA